MSHNIDFTTFACNSSTTDGYYKLGNLQFCWGTATVNIGTGAYDEAFHTFVFPVPFDTTPIIMLSNGDLSNPCGEYCLVNSTSSTYVTALVGHTREATSAKIKVYYLAVGVVDE